jgi:hypothetical protein
VSGSFLAKRKAGVTHLKQKPRHESRAARVEARILELKANGDGILKIGRKLGIGTSVVQRVFNQEPRPS